MRMVATASIAILLAGLVGCTSIKVTTDYDRGADFNGLDTYAWLPREQPKTGNVRLDNPLVDQRVRRAVDSALAAKGIALVTSRPRFLVAYNVALDKKIRVDTIHHGYGHGRYGWHGAYVATDTRVREYEVGSIILDVLEPRSRNLLWRGTASAKVTQSATPEQREKRINEAVSRMLEKFPPRAAS